MDVTASSSDDYVIHISSGESSPVGNSFRLRAGGSSTDLFAVEDNGAVNNDGRLIGDIDPIIVKDTSGTGGAAIATFKQSGSTKLVITNEGFVNTQSGGLVLRASATAPPGSIDDGDCYWRVNAGVWTFAIYYNSWVYLTLI